MNNFNEMDRYLSDQDIGLISTEPPKQTDFIKLIQWFGKEKILPGHMDITECRYDYRLIPYGGNLYGLHCDETAKGHQLFDDSFTLNTTYEGNREDLPTPIGMLKFCKEEYNLAKDKHKQYWDWKKNRNETRGVLEEAHGYDTKHAMHLVRLLRMGIEALRDGELTVKRPDAEELLSIRNGAWTYEEVVAYAESMDKEVREVWYNKTELRKKPDLKFAGALLMEVQDLVWSKST